MEVLLEEAWWCVGWFEGVVVLAEARREVREGGRRGVVGLLGGWRRVREVERWRRGGDAGVVDAIVRRSGGGGYTNVTRRTRGRRVES